MVTVLEHFINKFEGKNVDEFIANVREHIRDNEELIREWIEDGVDEQSIDCQEEYIRDIMGKHPIYKGIMTYNQVTEIADYCNKKGLICEDIFNVIEFKKANLEDLKEQIICEWVETDEEQEMIENIKTMKALREFLKGNMGNDWLIINGKFVSCLTLTN